MADGSLDRSQVGARRRKRTLEKILKGTLEALTSSSFDMLSIEDVIATSNVSRGTFYAYFRDKDDLSQTIAVLLNLIGERATLVASEDIDSPIDQVAIGVAVYLDFAARAPNIARVMLKEYVRQLPLQEPFSDQSRNLFDRLIEGGRKRGVFTVPSKDVAFSFLTGAVAFMVGSLVETKDEDKSSIIRHAVFHALLGLGVSIEQASASADTAIGQLPLADLEQFDLIVEELAQSLLDRLPQDRT